MLFQYRQNSKAPLLNWDIFCTNYNNLLEDAGRYHESLTELKNMARQNKWSKLQTKQAIANFEKYVIVITDTKQLISFTSVGFEQMTGYTSAEVYGRNPNFLQGSSTSKYSGQSVKNEVDGIQQSEAIIENYRKNGELYLCKIIIQPVININQKLVNYIAYEQEVAA